MNETKWDLRFLKLAKEISTWSKDPSTQVGAVITDKNKRIVSLGFNGFPKGITDSDERYLNRDTKLDLIIHAEINAITFANKDLTNHILYTYPMLPCVRCATQIIQNGISKVVSIKNKNERWTESINKSKEIFQEARITVVEYE